MRYEVHSYSMLTLPVFNENLDIADTDNSNFSGIKICMRIRKYEFLLLLAKSSSWRTFQ